MSSTVSTVRSKKGPKSDISGNSSSDIQSELNKALEMGGTLPEKINEKEKERLSPEDPAADSPGAAIRSTSIPPPPLGRRFCQPAWEKRSLTGSKASRAPPQRPSGVEMFTLQKRNRPARPQDPNRPVSNHMPFCSTTPLARRQEIQNGQGG